MDSKVINNQFAFTVQFLDGRIQRVGTDMTKPFARSTFWKNKR